MKKEKRWNGNAEICYQNDSEIPFIEVPNGKEMPEKLFMFEFKRTGEHEPGPDGSDVPICDMKAHIFFSYEVAKKILEPELLDKLRVAFGLKPLEEAMEKGKKITDKVTQNADLK